MAVPQKSIQTNKSWLVRVHTARTAAEMRKSAKRHMFIQWNIYGTYIWEVLCQKQVSRPGKSDNIPQYQWDVITCPCPWCLFFFDNSPHLQTSLLTHLRLVLHICQRIGVALVQIMACRLFGDKSLSKPMLEYCQKDPYEQTSVKFWSKFKFSHSRKCNWKYRLPKWWPFFPGGRWVKLN